LKKKVNFINNNNKKNAIVVIINNSKITITSHPYLTVVEGSIEFTHLPLVLTGVTLFHIVNSMIRRFSVLITLAVSSWICLARLETGHFFRDSARPKVSQIFCRPVRSNQTLVRLGPELGPEQLGFSSNLINLFHSV
jgi:hypothetical protein